jgi:hypothetical protein
MAAFTAILEKIVFENTDHRSDRDRDFKHWKPDFCNLKDP